MNNSYSPFQFCCNSGCTNCGFGVNKKCVKQFSKKKPCRVDNYKNGFSTLGKKAFNAYNIEYGYFPEHLKCFCRQRGPSCKIHIKKSCNCSNECVKLSLIIQKELSKNKSYMKVLNRYQDITYNTVDGWPPTAAEPTGHLSGSRSNTLAENMEEATAKLDRRFYRYNGGTYGHREFVDYAIMCGTPPNTTKKIIKRRVSCIPSAVRIG